MENNVLNEMDRVDPNLRDEMLAELFLGTNYEEFQKK